MNKCAKCLDIEPCEEPNDECLTASRACPPWCDECLWEAGTFGRCDTCQYWHPKDDLNTLDNGIKVCMDCMPGNIEDIHPPLPHTPIYP